MATSCSFRAFFSVALLIGLAGSVRAQQQGAETPEQLLKRLATGIQTSDIDQLTSCLLSRNGKEEKAAATAIAKSLLLQTDVKKFVSAVKSKYGDQFRQTVGLRAYLTMVTIGGLDFQALAKDSKIDIDEEKDTAVATHGEGLGEMTLNLVRQNGRWFVETHLGLRPGEKSIAELHYFSAVRFLKDCREALKNATDQNDFQTRVEQAAKAYQAAIRDLQ